MTAYLPAPYESAPDDDLGSAVAATLAASAGVLVAVSLGVQAWQQYPEASSVIKAFDGGSISGAPLELLFTTAGWALAALLMGLGGLLLIFRRGRGALVFGALVSIAVTAVARYQFRYFTPSHPLANVAVFFGGVAVIVLALLPQTRRWIAGRGHRRRGGLEPMMTATALTPTSVQIGPAR